MSKKLISVFSIITIAVMLLSASVVTPAVATGRSVEDMKLFRAAKFNAHYRVPNEGAISTMLDEAFVTLPGASAELKTQAEQQFLNEFNARNPDTPNPKKLKALLANENSPVAKGESIAAVDRSIKSLVTLVEFPEEYTWNANVFDAAGECTGTAPVTFEGPLHNEVTPPGPRDNNTIYYEDTSPALYEEIYFGEGPNAGVTANHPNLGDIFFKGKTMVNYYLEQSNGKFAPSGEVIPQWFQADYPEAWYGEDGCNGDHNIRAQDLVEEVIVDLDATGIVWEDFDGNDDGFVDNFTVIHAGAGQEGGGGAQGDFAIWSHASMVGWPDGVLVCETPDAQCPTRDIYVGDYSMDPEMVDLGVIAEEFGHAAFGLPDIYTTDAQGSPSNWAIMESGSWNGQLGGMEPAPFPLWFRYVIGWAQPTVKEIDYDDPAATTKVGQLSKTPKGTFEGVRINLPDKDVTVPNPAGEGQGIWSNVGDGESFQIQRSFDLTGLTAPVFSFDSYWSIEDDYDYGYVEVSTDAGVTWTALDDTGAAFTTDGDDVPALTGVNEGTLSFDLSAYAGQAAVLVRLRYETDPGVQYEGWFVDNVALTDGATSVWSDDFTAGLGAWTTTDWLIVPLAQSYPRYYLVEWRNNSGYDQGLQYAYTTVYSDDDEWLVDRGPYTVPGMLIWLRDTSYMFDYTLLDSIYDEPSYGPKHALLVVDSHYFPYEWDNWVYPTSGAHVRLNARLQPGNATFTLQPTTPFAARLGVYPGTSYYQEEPIDEQVFGPQPAVSQFHDSLGYWPGLWYNYGNDGLYFWDAVSSMAIPAAEPYTTKITYMDKKPAYMLYGTDMGDTVLGSGNPGDEGAQYGLHIAVSSKAGNGSYGMIKTWNSEALTEVSMKATPAPVKAGAALTYTVKVKNVTPVAQKVTVDVPVPGKTVFLSGAYFRKYTNSIHWEGSIAAGATRTLVFRVKVFPGLAPGATITANAFVKDDALGSAGELITLTQ